MGSSHVHVADVLDLVGPFDDADVAGIVDLDVAFVEHPGEDVRRVLVVVGSLLLFG